MLSLQLDVNVPDLPFHGHPIGIDVGLETFLATSDGQLIRRPKFFTILSYVAWKRGKYFGKVNKDGTSQTCPNCDAHTGKKTLEVRVHSCPECGYTTHRDVAAAMVIRNRGVNAVGQTV